MSKVQGSIVWLGQTAIEVDVPADELRKKLRGRGWIRLTAINGYVNHVRVSAVTIISDRVVQS